MFVEFFGYVFTIFILVRILLKIWNIFYPHIIARALGLGVDLKSLGKWAVITGATDGIGKAYAIELARRGINVYLISRNPEKLANVKKEIEQKAPNAECRTHAIDFGTSDLKKYDEISQIFFGLDVGILINNVGFDFEIPEKFLEFPGGMESIQHMINVNCLAATLMTKIILPSMVKKSKGVLLFLSSATSIVPCPYFSIYSATKAYLTYLTSALDHEYRENGIISQVVCPFFVRTNMASGKLSALDTKMPMPVMDPESYVKAALATIGIQKRTSGCFLHEIQFEFLTSLPRWWLISFLKRESARTSQKMKSKKE